MMIAKRKRVLVAVADTLGWLNWADQRVVRLAMGEPVSKADIADIKRLGTTKPRARRSAANKPEISEHLTEDPEEGLGALEFQVSRQFSQEDLEKAQPGPVFSEQPEAFVSWVQVSLKYLEQQREVGISPELAAEIGRGARIWIASGFIGRQTKKSTKFLPALIKLWNTAIELEQSHWSMSDEAVNRRTHR